MEERGKEAYSLSSVALRRFFLRNKTSPTTRAMSRTPPTTPPTMAPMGLLPTPPFACSPVVLVDVEG